MPQPNWWYSNFDAGGNPQKNLVPQSDMFDSYNRDVGGGLPTGGGLSAAQLGELWRFAQKKSPGTPYNPAQPPLQPFSQPPPMLDPHQANRTLPVAPNKTSLPFNVPMVPPPVFQNYSITPTDSEFNDALARARQVDDNNRAYYERMNPGSTSRNDQLSRNIDDAAHGRLAPEDEADILRKGAEMGAAMGSPDSPSARAGALTRLYGGIQALKDKAEALATSQFNRTLKPTSPTDYMVKPEQKIQLIIEQARLSQAALTSNQEATLKLQLQTMIESGRGLDRDLSLKLKEMEQAGQIRHDETVRLISDADRVAGNYRAGLQNSGENYRANLVNSGANYRALLDEQNKWNLGKLHYGNQAPINFPTSPNGYGGGYTPSGNSGVTFNIPHGGYDSPGDVPYPYRGDPSYLQRFLNPGDVPYPYRGDPSNLVKPFGADPEDYL